MTNPPIDPPVERHFKECSDPGHVYWCSYGEHWFWANENGNWCSDHNMPGSTHGPECPCLWIEQEKNG